MSTSQWHKERLWVDYVEGETTVQEEGEWLEEFSKLDRAIIKNLKYTREEIKVVGHVDVPKDPRYWQRLQNNIMTEVREYEQKRVPKESVYLKVLRQFPLHRFGR